MNTPPPFYPPPPGGYSVSPPSPGRTLGRPARIALTVIAALYLTAQLVAMVIFFLVFSAGWGMPYDMEPLPWPVFLIWIPSFLLQAGLVGTALWLLWRKPKEGRVSPPTSRTAP